MHAVLEAKSMFRFVPRGADEPKGEWLRRAGQFFGLTPAQAKKIEYQEVKDLRASRLDNMRARLNEAKERAEKREELADGIRNRIAAARSAAGSGDVGGRSGGIGAADRGGLGTGEGSDREGGQPASSRTDEG
jgi:hypothetical protein